MERMRRSATKEKDFIARELTANRVSQFQYIEISFAIISINIFLIKSRTLVNTKFKKTLIHHSCLKLFIFQFQNI